LENYKDELAIYSLPSVLFSTKQNRNALADLRLEVDEDFLFAIKYHVNGVADALEALIMFRMKQRQQTPDTLARRKVFLERLRRMNPGRACDLMIELL